jgi:hypothetical protein
LLVAAFDDRADLVQDATHQVVVIPGGARIGCRGRRHRRQHAAVPDEGVDDRGHAPAQVLDPAQVGHVPPQLRGSTDLSEDVRRGLPQDVRLVEVVDVERRLRHARLCGESVDGRSPNVVPAAPILSTASRSFRPSADLRSSRDCLPPDVMSRLQCADYAARARGWRTVITSA